MTAVFHKCQNVFLLGYAFCQSCKMCSWTFLNFMVNILVGMVPLKHLFKWLCIHCSNVVCIRDSRQESTLVDQVLDELVKRQMNPSMLSNVSSNITTLVTEGSTSGSSAEKLAPANSTVLKSYARKELFKGPIPFRPSVLRASSTSTSERSVYNQSKMCMLNIPSNQQNSKRHSSHHGLKSIHYSMFLLNCIGEPTITGLTKSLKTDQWMGAPVCPNIWHSNSPISLLCDC